MAHREPAQGERLPTQSSRSSFRKSLELGVGLTDDREIGKGVVHLSVHTLRVDQPHLLQAAELILPDMPVPLENLSSRDSRRSEGGHARSL